MHMNEGREEAENNMKQHISAHGEVNGNFTVVFNARKNHQTLSKKPQFIPSIWIFTDFVILSYTPDLDRNTETQVRVLTSYRNEEWKRVI